MTEDELKVIISAALLWSSLYEYCDHVMCIPVEISDWPVPGFERCGSSLHEQNMLYDAL